MRKPNLAALLVVIWAPLLVAACGSESAAPASCVPNQSVACACGGGKVGRQICNAAGSELSVCSECGTADSDASAEDSSEADSAPAVPDGSSDAPVEAAPPGVGVTGTLGTACTPIGALGCAGNHQKLTILCGAGGAWEKNTTCAAEQFCDSTPGVNAGTCQTPPFGCEGREPGFAFCYDEVTPAACGVDTVTLDKSTCPISCWDAVCGVCKMGEERCNGTVPQVCLKAQWKDETYSCTACVVTNGHAQCKY